MDSRKIVGIIFIILGLLFIVSPLTSLIAVSLVAGISLIAFGLMTIIDGFSLFSRMAGISGLKIVLGILALILGALFIFHIQRERAAPRSEIRSRKKIRAVKQNKALYARTEILR